MMICLIFAAAFVMRGPEPANPLAVAMMGTAARLAAELARAPNAAQLHLRSAVSLEHLGIHISTAACPDGTTHVTLSDEDGSTWQFPDPHAGLSDITDFDRILRERLDIPVPRRLPPAMIPQTVLSLPEDTTPAQLLQAVYTAEGTSWAQINDTLLLRASDTDQIDDWRARGGQTAPDSALQGQPWDDLRFRRLRL